MGTRGPGGGFLVFRDCKKTSENHPSHYITAISPTILPTMFLMHTPLGGNNGQVSVQFYRGCKGG